MKLITLQKLHFSSNHKTIDIIHNWKEHLVLRFALAIVKVYPSVETIYWYLEIQASILEHLLKKHAVSDS